MTFRLQNEPTRPAGPVFEEPERLRQTTLLAGLDCLPGQLDLFATDGEGRATDEPD